MMNAAAFALILMLLAHLLADYPLQGWLAQAKARKYWEDSPKKNRHDYVPALACHALMWAILVALPPSAATMFWGVGNPGRLWFLWGLIPAQALLHACIDHCKATYGYFNLWQDQLIHLAQIAAWWGCWLGACQVL